MAYMEYHHSSDMELRLDKSLRVGCEPPNHSVPVPNDEAGSVACYCGALTVSYRLDGSGYVIDANTNAHEEARH